MSSRISGTGSKPSSYDRYVDVPRLLLAIGVFFRVGIPCLVAAFAVLLLMTFFLWPLIGFAGLAPAS
jgi:hypothetical protein